MRRRISIGLALPLLLSASACGGSPRAHDGSATTTTASHFTMTLSATRLEPGASFTVTYATDLPGGLHTGDDVGLYRGDEELNKLVARDGPDDPFSGVYPPDETSHAVSLGPGPHFYKLPDDLASGSYRICGGVFANDPPGTPPRKGEIVCADFTV